MKTLKMVVDSATAQMSVESSQDWISILTSLLPFVNLSGVVALISLISNVDGFKKDLGDFKKDLGDFKGDVKKDLGDFKDDIKDDLGDFKKEQTKHLRRLERGTKRGFSHVIKDIKELQSERKIEEEIDEMFEESQK